MLVKDPVRFTSHDRGRRRRVHRACCTGSRLRFAGNCQLVAGAFSSDPERGKNVTGEAIGLAADRTYGSFAELIERERAGQRTAQSSSR